MRLFFQFTVHTFSESMASCCYWISLETITTMLWRHILVNKNHVAISALLECFNQFTCSWCTNMFFWTHKNNCWSVVHKFSRFLLHNAISLNVVVKANSCVLSWFVISKPFLLISSFDILNSSISRCMYSNFEWKRGFKSSMPPASCTHASNNWYGYSFESILIRRKSEWNEG